MTIEQESGAKVTFIKDKRTEKYRTTFSNDGRKVQNDAGKEGEGNGLEKIRVDAEVETPRETIWEEKPEELNEDERVKIGENGRLLDEHKTWKTDDISEEQQNNKSESIALPEEGK